MNSLLAELNYHGTNLTLFDYKQLPEGAKMQAKRHRKISDLLSSEQIEPKLVLTLKEKHVSNVSSDLP